MADSTETINGIPVLYDETEKNTINGIPIYEPDKHDSIAEDLATNHPELAKNLKETGDTSRKAFKDYPKRLSKKDREKVVDKLGGFEFPTEDELNAPRPMSKAEARAKAWEGQIKQKTEQREADRNSAESGLRAGYNLLKHTASGASLGATDWVLDPLEQAVVGDDAKPKTMEDKIMAGTGEIAGMVLSMPKAAEGVSKVGKMTQNLKYIKDSKFLAKPWVKSLLQRTSTAATTSAARSLNQVARGNIDKMSKGQDTNWAGDSKEALKQVALNTAGSAVSWLPENLIDKGALNFTGQVLTDFVFDAVTDLGFRDRLKNQSLSDWFVSEELPQMALSVSMAARDNYFDNDFKPLLKKNAKKKINRELKGQLNDDLKQLDEKGFVIRKPQPLPDDLNTVTRQLPQYESMSSETYGMVDRTGSETPKTDLDAEINKELDKWEKGDKIESGAAGERLKELYAEKERVESERENDIGMRKPTYEIEDIQEKMKQPEPPPLPKEPSREKMPNEIDMARRGVEKLEPFVGGFKELRKKWNFPELMEKSVKDGHVDNALNVAKDVLISPRPLKKEEAMGLVLRSTEIANERDKILDEWANARERGADSKELDAYDQRLVQLDKQMSTISDAAKLQASEAGSAAKVIDGIIARDSFDIDNLKRTFSNKTGREPTQSEVAALREMSRNAMKLNKERESLKNDMERLKEEALNDFTPTKDELKYAEQVKDIDAEMAQLTEQLKKALMNPGRTSDVSQVMASSAESLDIIRKMAVLKAKKLGISKKQALEKVVAELPEEAGLDKMDLFQSINFNKPVKSKKVIKQADEKIGGVKKVNKAINDASRDIDKLAGEKTNMVGKRKLNTLKKSLLSMRPKEPKTPDEEAEYNRWMEKLDELIDRIDRQAGLVPVGRRAAMTDDTKAILEDVKTLSEQLPKYDSPEAMKAELKNKKYTGRKKIGGMETVAYKEHKAEVERLKQELKEAENNAKASKIIKKHTDLTPTQAQAKAKPKVPVSSKSMSGLRELRDSPDVEANLKAKIDDMLANYDALVQSKSGVKPKENLTPESIQKLKDQIADIHRSAQIDKTIQDYERMKKTGDFSDLTPRERYRVKSELLMKKEAELMAAKASLAKAIRIAGLKQGKSGAYLKEALDFQREMMTMADVSALGRQMLGLGIAHPIRYAQAINASLKNMWSQKDLDEMMASIHKHPDYALASKYIEEMDYGGGSDNEFYGSLLAEKIPGVKQVANVSGRSFAGGINALRYSVMFDFIKKVKELQKLSNGEMSDADVDAQLKSLGDFVNASTGSGMLPEKYRPLLSGILFAPRYAYSKPEILYKAIMPEKAGGYSGMAKKEAWKSLGAQAALASSVAGLAYAMGWDIGMDPMSPDFLKVVNKKTGRRWDLLQGYQQPVRTALRIIIGASKGEKALDKDKFVTLIKDYLQYKGAPWLNTANMALYGKNIVGEKQTLTSGLMNSFLPISGMTALQSSNNVIPDDSWLKKEQVVPKSDNEDGLQKILAILSEESGLFSSQQYKKRKTGRKKSIYKHKEIKF